MKTAWINGRFGERISPHDPGFLNGLGVFETIGVFGGQMPLWDAHLQRLRSGAESLGIEFEPPADLHPSAMALLAREPGDDVLRITLTPGPGAAAEGAAGEGEGPTWCMTTRHRRIIDRPLRLHPASFMRHRTDPVAVIKCTSYAFHFMAAREAEAAGADDAILLGEDERILETTTGNIFFIRRGVLHTPKIDGGFLPGIGREALLSGLQEQGVGVEKGNYSLQDLRLSAGIFVTNAVHGPRPATLHEQLAVPLDSTVVAAWQAVIAPRTVRRD